MGLQLPLICVGLTKLNENVREKFVLPTIDSILHKLTGSSVYSTLDAASWFWQISLDDESSKLTIFITPKGHYCFKRLHRRYSKEGYRNCCRTMWELLSHEWYSSAWCHDGRTDCCLKRVMETIQESGLKLNCQRCHRALFIFWAMLSVRLASLHALSVPTITALETPKNVSELRRVLGKV